MSSANTTVDQEKFGGEMSKGEIHFCNQLRELLRAAREGRIPFQIAMADIVGDIHKLWNEQYDRGNGEFHVDDAKYSGWHVVCANKEKAEGVEPPTTRPSELEIAFLDDMDGLIDYAMRNGIDFVRVVGAIGHDVNMIRQHDWSLERAERESCFRPMVGGWAQRNVAPIGDSEPETE